MAANLSCKALIAASALAGAFTWSCTPAFAKDWFPYPVQQWDPPFDMNSPRKNVNYTPLPKAAKKWNICVSFPHMKDAYWMGVDYGVVEESKRLGVKMQLVEAGGYTEQEADHADRGLRGRGRQCRGDRRHLGGWPEQSRIRNPEEEHPRHRRHQRHLLA